MQAIPVRTSLDPTAISTAKSCENDEAEVINCKKAEMPFLNESSQLTQAYMTRDISSGGSSLLESQHAGRKRERKLQRKMLKLDRQIDNAFDRCGGAMSSVEEELLCDEDLHIHIHHRHQ